MFRGVLQLYDEWQHQENALLIDKYSTSRSTAMPVGYNMGWTALFIRLVCFGTKSKTGMGKSNSKIETDLSDIIRYEIRGQWLANSGLKKTGLGEETECSHRTNTQTLISIFQCVKSKTSDPHSQTRQSLESGCRACVLSSCAHNRSPRVCEFMLFIFH